MGLLISKVFRALFGNTEVRILILGLDGAGKTTIVYKLVSPNEVITTPLVPTIGFNVETVSYKNVKLQVWDLGGQTNIRPYWRCYYPNTNAIIFVVDSADTDRISIARQELLKLLVLFCVRVCVCLFFFFLCGEKTHTQTNTQGGGRVAKCSHFSVCK